MQNGFVSMRAIILLLIGVAGAGKTSFCHLLFDESPPPVRKSTPLAKSSIRAMSTSKAIIVSTQKEEEATAWKRVLPREFKSLIADAIKESKWVEQQHQPISMKENKPQISYLQAVKSLQPSDLYKWLQKQRHHEQPPDSEHSLPTEQRKQNDEEKHVNGEEAAAHDNTELENGEEPTSAEIEQLFESQSIQQLFKLIANSKGSTELLRQEWLYLIDTGGQPQFHELLPTFVHHVSAASFFIKLNETLKDHPIIEYYDEQGVPCGQPYKSSHNHLQTLQNCLQAMQSRHEINGNPECPELFFVGTHRDIENKKETLKSKNKLLVEELQQHDVFRHHLNYCSLGKFDQLLYPVNAKTPGKTDKKIAADFRQDVMNGCKKCAHEYKIPIQWFVLEMLLQELSQDGVISFQQCCYVASRLGMDETRLQAAIEYLIKLNIFEYFPSILPNIVFTTSQVLLNKVTELVEYSHELRCGSSSHHDSTDIKFRDYGEISIEMLERAKFSKHYVKGLFEPKDLLKLCVELLVIAEGPNGLIMPAVLPELQLEQLSKHRFGIESSNLGPIAVHYPGGLFPSGIFSSLISHLQSKSKWKISMLHNKPCLFKNCIKFSVSSVVIANVTLIYSHKWIELHAYVFNEDQQKACLLRDDLFDGLEDAEKVQKYSAESKLAFFCNCQGEFYQHLASATSDGKFMRCMSGLA